MKILIAYDGTIHARRALQYGIEKVRGSNGGITVLHVFDRTRFVDYDAGLAAEDAARREAAAHLKEAKSIAAASGVTVDFIAMEGDAGAALRAAAGKENPDLLLATPGFRTAVRSVSRPVLMLPGTVLVPVDGSGAAQDIDAIVREARALGSQVLVLGIVPVHLFSREEKDELAAVKRSTEESARDLRGKLKEQGVEATSIVRSGYPDEEILSAANDHGASLIMLPSGGEVPSELSKAAAILLDEPERLSMPVVIMGHAGA